MCLTDWMQTMPFTVDIHCLVTVVRIHIEYHIDWLIILGERWTCPLDEEEVPVAGQYVVQQPGPSRRRVAVDKQLDQHLHVTTILQTSPVLLS